MSCSWEDCQTCDWRFCKALHRDKEDPVDTEVVDDCVVCPVCDHQWSIMDNFTGEFNYCPHCGQRWVNER